MPHLCTQENNITFSGFFDRLFYIYFVFLKVTAELEFTTSKSFDCVAKIYQSHRPKNCCKIFFTTEVWPDGYITFQNLAIYNVLPIPYKICQSSNYQNFDKSGYTEFQSHPKWNIRAASFSCHRCSAHPLLLLRAWGCPCSCKTSLNLWQTPQSLPSSLEVFERSWTIIILMKQRFFWRFVLFLGIADKYVWLPSYNYYILWTKSGSCLSIIYYFTTIVKFCGLSVWAAKTLASIAA